MDWGRETQRKGTHRKALAVVQVGSDGGLSWECGEEEEVTDGGERDWGNIVHRIRPRACTHVGSKLPEIDSKQRSTVVATFLNFW